MYEHLKIDQQLKIDQIVCDLDFQVQCSQRSHLISYRKMFWRTWRILAKQPWNMFISSKTGTKITLKPPFWLHVFQFHDVWCRLTKPRRFNQAFHRVGRGKGFHHVLIFGLGGPTGPARKSHRWTSLVKNLNMIQLWSGYTYPFAYIIIYRKKMQFSTWMLV